MIESVGCSWCHDLVRLGGPTWPSCPSCQHRVDVARLVCDCARCRRSGSVRVIPLDLVEAIARCGPLPGSVKDRLRFYGLSEPEIRALDADEGGVPWLVEDGGQP